MPSCLLCNSSDNTNFLSSVNKPNTSCLARSQGSSAAQLVSFLLKKSFLTFVSLRPKTIQVGGEMSHRAHPQSQSILVTTGVRLQLLDLVGLFTILDGFLQVIVGELHKSRELIPSLAVSKIPFSGRFGRIQHCLESLGTPKKKRYYQR